jgi:segregation and condensation protein A
MQEQIYDLLIKEDELTWQDIIYNLIKTEQMDPWDVDITKITQKYITVVKKMKDMNYKISGKMVLASAILLKMKSKKLIEEDINNFDSFLFHTEEEHEELDDFMPYQHDHKIEIPRLGIKTPQSRKRKVSVRDLIGALERALRVDTRRKLRLQKFLSFNKPEIPEKKIDISKLIDKIYAQVMKEFAEKEKINFHDLLPKGATKQDTVLTLLPLLHLHNFERLDLTQDETFGDISINKHEAS